MDTGIIKVGATCHIGKGKTVWEIINIREDALELSALGKGGYVNKSAHRDQVSHVQAQRLDVTLGAVLSERARARAAVSNLHDALRFTNTDRIDCLNATANGEASSYAYACRAHSKGLAALGIKEGD